MRLLLGLPTAGSPTAPFLKSLAALALPQDCIDFDRCVVGGNFIPAQRELLFEEALARNFDVLAMIDDDIEFPPDALARMISVLDEDPITALVGALYYSRDGLRPMAVDNWSGMDTTAAFIPAFDTSAVIVDGVGFGCVVVRLSAVAQLQLPLLSAHIFVQREARRVWVADEDYLFCERLRQNGHRVRLHAGVRCRHFDRKTEQFSPSAWEDSGITSQARMFVQTPEGEALIPADERLPRGRERHRAVTFDYLSVE